MFSRLCRLLSHQTCLVKTPTTRLPRTSTCRLGGSRRFLLSAAVLATYDWEKETVSDQELAKHYQEIDLCRQLKMEALTCKQCGRRIRLDTEVEGVPYCTCPGQNSAPTTSTSWVPYVERRDVLVWRREHETKQGQYQYKVHGVFDDVTVWEFLAVQLDLTKFRLTWDANTAQLSQVDTRTEDAVVYHWEVNWPAFFSNRDYCCVRQSVASSTGQAVVMSRSTSHPACPLTRRTHRVEDYLSVLVIRPSGPVKGVEFCLTAFEDPGVKLPETLTSWVAVRAMPDLFNNLRAACIKLRTTGKSEQQTGFLLPVDLQRRAEENKSVVFNPSSGVIWRKKEAQSSDDATVEADRDKVDLSVKEGCLALVTDQALLSDSETVGAQKAPQELKLLGDTDDSELNESETELMKVEDKTAEFHSKPVMIESNISAMDLDSELIDRPLESNKIVSLLNSSQLIGDNISLPSGSSLDELKKTCQKMSSDQSKLIQSQVGETNQVVKSSIEILPSAPNKTKTVQRPVFSKMRSSLLYPGYVENELELLVYEEREVERQTSLLDLRLREVGGQGRECEELVQAWCELVHRKNKSFHRRIMLELLEREEDLESKWCLLQQELNMLSEVRTDEDMVREQLLLEELVIMVNMRDDVVMKVDQEENCLQLQEEIARRVEGMDHHVSKRDCNMQ